MYSYFDYIIFYSYIKKNEITLKPLFLIVNILRVVFALPPRPQHFFSIHAPMLTSCDHQKSLTKQAL